MCMGVAKMTTYTTTRVKFEELTKKVNRIFKKLDKVGANHKFYEVRSFVKSVPVYAVDDITGTTNHVDDMNVECVEYVMEFDPYVVGNYRFGAVVERTTDANENLVYVQDDEAVADFAKYRTTDLVCEHCNTNHNRTKCVVLVDNTNGTHKMVGRACLKDFIGYNVETFSKYFKEIQQILLEDAEPVIYDNERGRYAPAIDVVEYMANCIKIVKTYGYNKEVKETALRAMHKNKIEDKYIEEAKKVIQFFEENEEKLDGEFEHNTRIFVTGRKPVLNYNGFVAYAYTLYEKIVEREIAKVKAEEQKVLSNYVGTVGAKITITGTMKAIAGYETTYGYTTIYKIVDENNNVYIWKTGNTVNTDGKVQVTGTIKAHEEYRGEKQTVLTRCKVYNVEEETNKFQGEQVDTSEYFNLEALELALEALA